MEQKRKSSSGGHSPGLTGCPLPLAWRCLTFSRSHWLSPAPCPTLSHFRQVSLAVPCPLPDAVSLTVAWFPSETCFFPLCVVLVERNPSLLLPITKASSLHLLVYPGEGTHVPTSLLGLCIWSEWCRVSGLLVAGNSIKSGQLEAERRIYSKWDEVPTDSLGRISFPDKSQAVLHDSYSTLPQLSTNRHRRKTMFFNFQHCIELNWNLLTI